MPRVPKFFEHLLESNILASVNDLLDVLVDVVLPQLELADESFSSEGAEEFVKYALKKTLDNQVERKARDAVDEKARALREDQTTLNALAIEMRQSRFREMQDRNEQAEMLSATWTKQKALKDMERALGKK